MFDYYSKFEYEGKVYKVSERVGHLMAVLRSTKIKEPAIRIVESQNYQEGKIPEYMLLTALSDSYSDQKYNK